MAWEVTVLASRGFLCPELLKVPHAHENESQRFLHVELSLHLRVPTKALPLNYLTMTVLYIYGGDMNVTCHCLLTLTAYWVNME